METKKTKKKYGYIKISQVQEVKFIISSSVNKQSPGFKNMQR